ncbi:hypothetical protein KXV54_004655 [Aspergillus fumigatus]|nr:hypothetical protein KXV54_004655 [Aspergillus fumigatus]
MKTLRIVRSTISILAVLSQLQLSDATPLEVEEVSLKEAGLEKRCANPCGYYSQLCCTSSQTCGTNSQGQAVCLDSSGGSGGGTWEYYTTTYVLTETDTKTITSTWSSLIPTATGSTSCRTDLGETACGNTCCGAAFVCANDQCIVGSSSIWVTATATPPVRGTTQSTMTQIATATTTQGFIPPVGTDGATLIGVHAGGGGLSGGAIAGIVIGVIAGVFILLLLCACMCCKGALDALFACLCPGRRKRKDTTYVEERYHHHAHGSKPEGRTWFGTRPSASEGGEKKSKWGSLATIGIILGALALCLGLRRRKDEDEKSDYTYPSSYYYYSDYYTSATAAAQQQHYNRIAMAGNGGAGNAAQGAGAGALNGENALSGAVSVMDGGISDENRKVFIWIAELLDPNRREAALMELSKKREQVPELALVIWHSFGVMTALLQEIISVYPLLNPSQLTAAASNRVCNALALLQCVASHNETRTLFLNAHIPLFLYPFLNTTSKSRPFEYLRLTSLGVIGALVKNDSSDVINFLLTTEIIPLCLRIMETGSELSKTVAIFIVQKILLDDIGLAYICATYERFYAVGTVLSNMVTQLVEQQTVRLLKHVVRCFLRLSDNSRAREALRQCLPEPLRDATFSSVLRDDAATKRCLAQLLINLSDNVSDGASGVTM